ncbi:MAG: NAD(P)H-binding protein [Saprospiraceae bacterium]|nr:NAD(P)H-binding protein [Saprospiraceae bacterium]
MELEIVKDQKTAVLLGATGLVGGYCLRLLLEHGAYGKVIAFTRRTLPVSHPKLEQHVVDFNLPQTFHHLLKGDDLFCCLGTTMAKAGNKEAFYKVDYTYAYEAALAAVQNKVNQFLLVSSVGADPKSMFYYSRVKGELEDAIKSLPFWAIHIFQPSVLLGERNENRWGEQWAAKIGRRIDALTGGLLSKYRPVEAEVVAAAMVSVAQQFEPGIHVYPSHYLQQLSEQV